MSAVPFPVVCAWCERVRTSDGRWEDAGIADRDAAETTHGICPECLVEETRAAALAPAWSSL